MAAFKVGDAVSVLNETIRGKIVATGLSRSRIEDEDGFIREYPNHLLVPRKSTNTYRLTDDEPDPEIRLKLASFSGGSKKNSKPARAADIPMEIDLHYEELVEYSDARNDYQILQKQLTACRSFIRKAIGNKTRKVVIIHGKGEGVLKAEIHLYLNRLQAEHGIKLEFHDAPYSEYGMGGATEVIFY